MKYVVNAANNADGNMYWYFTRHGVQPGSIPRGGDVGDIKDTPNGTYFQFSRPMTTKELNEYEIKEANIDSITSSVTSRSDVNDTHFHIGDRVRQAYANPYNVGTIEDIMDDDTYGVQWDYSDGPDFEYVNKDEIELLTSSFADSDYIEALAEEIKSKLNDQGFSNNVSLDDDFITIEIDPDEDTSAIFIQPIADIDGVWDDLDADASQLAEAALDEYYK